MKYLEPHVVVVDDKKEEVGGIINYYREEGVGCKYFDATPGAVDYPDNPFSDVNLVFLDLFYKPGSQLDPEEPVAWIRSIIPEKAFYILVIWTKDISDAQIVLDLLNEKERKPYLSIIENKGGYINNAGDYDYTRLLKSVHEKINEVPALEEIRIWKNLLKKTSNVLLGNLLYDNPEDFTKKLKKVMKGHGGKIVQTDSPDKAEKNRSVLFEALNSVLASNVPQFDAENEISAENKADLYDLSGMETVALDRQLNSWFHFTFKCDLKRKTFPGIIALNNDAQLREYYSVQDDEIIKKLLSFQKSSKDTVIEDIVVNITRPCDYAQNKYGKNLKLLSGVLIRKPLRKENDKKEIKLDKPVPDSVKCFDNLHYDKDCEDITLLFDFRYSFSVPASVFINGCENIKMLNKELLSELQVSYSNYVSRLGYTNIF